MRQNKSNDPHTTEYDEDLPEHVIILNDWYNNSVAYKFAFQIHADGREAAQTKSILINGRAAEEAVYSRSGYSQSDCNRSGMKTPRAIFHVNKSRRYRFRLIHAGANDCPIQFSIESHNFSVIALDSNPTEKVENVEAVFLYPGKEHFIL